MGSRSGLEQLRMDNGSRAKILLAGQPATESLTGVGHMSAASPVDVDLEEKVGPTPARPAH
eukprot:3711450-Pyramimonas_sp.AAC.1